MRLVQLPHVHLSFWHPASSILEYIPWIKDRIKEPVPVSGSDCVRPEQPGAGPTPIRSSFETFGKSP